jgi:proteasome accessory factor A
MCNSPVTVAKVLGADFEFSNALIGKHPRAAHEAAALLLSEIVGYPRRGQGGTAIEYGRRFLDTCGSSWYIDSDHLEANLPEHTSAFDHPKILHGAGFVQARQAWRAAEARLPPGTRLNLLANCSDGIKSWGHHLNIMLTRACFDDMLYRKPHQAAFFATHLVTSVLYTGQGMVGASNGRAACSYQLSQRADWFETFASQQTMFDRPLINLRDEPHAADQLARLHVIYFDMVLSPIANILKAGTTQLVLAMIEAGWTDASLCLDDPVAAASEVSRDLQLRKALRTVVRGRLLTALDIQRALACLAEEFVATGAADGIVPDAEQIVSLWLETIEMLQGREVEVLAKRCDAWLKFLLLDRERGRRNLSWSSDRMRVADSLFASLDPDVSFFFQAADNGFVEGMPDAATLERFAWEPPDDTRAYFRAHVLRRHGDAVSAMDWSRITFRVPGARHWWSFADLPLRDPRRLNRTETETLLEECTTLVELVDAANALVQGQPATAIS